MKTIAIISQHPELQDWVKQQDAMIKKYSEQKEESFRKLHAVSRTLGLIPEDAEFDDWAMEVDTDHDVLKTISREQHAEAFGSNAVSELLLSVRKAMQR